MESKPKILYVDDEPINLKTFKAAFSEDFEVITAETGAEGLNIFNEYIDDGLAVVISDQRMPSMTGVDFLERVHQLNPMPIRIILTAYSDFYDISEAVNKGHIYQFIQKPWEYKTLRPILLRAVDVYTLAKHNEQLISDLEQSNQQLLESNQRLQDELENRKEEEKKRRDAEIMMLSQAKLASLGEMATGIAHEVNQPLSYINVILQGRIRDDSSSPKHLVSRSRDEVHFFIGNGIT